MHILTNRPQRRRRDPRTFPIPTRQLRVALLLALAALLFATIGPAARPVAAGAHLTAQCGAIADRAAEVDGRVGVVVLDLNSGEQCLVDAHETFLTASLYKVIVLAEGYRQEAAGTFSWDDTITVTPEHQEDVPSSRRTTYTISAREAATEMIQISDNVTARALREHLGRSEMIAAPGWLGMAGTELGEEFTTNANDIARLFSLISHGQVVSPAASAEMYALLAGQEIQDRLPRELPAEAVLAHKTGNLERSAHDAGIVTGPGGSLVVVVLTSASEAATVDDGYDAIAEIAEIAYATIATAPVVADPANSGEPLLPTAPLTLRLGEPLIVPVGQEPAAAFAALPAPVTVAPAIPPLALVPSSGGADYRWLIALGGLASLALFPASRYAYRAFRAPHVATAAAPSAAMHSLLKSPPGATGGRRRSLQTAQLDTMIPIAGGAAVDQDERLAHAKGDPMRFGARNARDEDPRQVEHDFVEAPEATTPAAAAPIDGTDASERLRRLSSYFDAQGDLLHEMSTQVRTETQPLALLLGEQRETMRAVLENLEDRLRPLQQYASSEEANLASLEAEMTSGGMDFVARSFADYLDDQRHRITSTRDQISDQRRPFVQYGEQQREAVEVALSRFDDDLLALESNLAEQRRVMMRMLDAMRSETFVGAREFLAEREHAVRRAAEEGITDPGELAGRLRPLREQIASGDSEYTTRLLAITDAADHDLAEVARLVGGPRPVPPQATAPEATAADAQAADDDDDAEDEQTA